MVTLYVGATTWVLHGVMSFPSNSRLHGLRRTTGQHALVQNHTVNTIIGHTQIDPQFRCLKAFFSHVWDDRREDKISMGLSLLFILTPPLFLLLASISSMKWQRKELETSILRIERLLSKQNGVFETGTFHSFLIVFVHFGSFLEIVDMNRHVNVSAVPMAAKPMPQQKVNLHKTIYNIDKLNANFPFLDF